MYTTSKARSRGAAVWGVRSVWLGVAAGLMAIGTAACEREVPSAPSAAAENVTVAGSIGGVVLTLGGAPVAGAVVSTPGGASAVTGANGTFSIGGLAPAQRLPVTVTATNYAPTTRIYRVVPGAQLAREIRLIPQGNPVTLVAGQGGTVPFAGGQGSVQIPANAFAGVSPGDPVVVRVAYWDPANAAVFRTAPGDFQGIEADGSQSVLASNGMVNIRVTNTQGQLLTLAANQVLTINVPDRVANTTTTTPPCQWGLYRWDPTEGRWVFVRPVAPPIPGTVLSWVDANGVSWNIDCSTRSSGLPIRVVDAVGNPVANLSVTAAGLSYFGGGETWTDANGFATIQLGASQQVSVQAGSASAQVVTPAAGSSGPLVTLVL